MRHAGAKRIQFTRRDRRMPEVGKGEFRSKLWSWTRELELRFQPTDWPYSDTMPMVRTQHVTEKKKFFDDGRKELRAEVGHSWSKQSTRYNDPIHLFKCHQQWLLMTLLPDSSRSRLRVCSVSKRFPLNHMLDAQVRADLDAIRASLLDIQRPPSPLSKVLQKER